MKWSQQLKEQLEEDIEAGTSKVESTVDGVSRGLAMIVIFQHVKHA